MRKPRVDAPGLFLNVGNRGVGRRTIFERDRDARFFLSLLARMVRAGEIEVHAFVLMPNHYHLLVKSTNGRIAEVMHWIQYRFARRFNLERGRTGHLFGSRFWSEAIEDAAYWENLVRYIDQNPVRAGICAEPAEYPYGSARHYCAGKAPPWLTGDLVSATIRASGGDGCYELVFGTPTPPGFIRLMEAGRLLGRQACPPLGRLIGASTPALRDWLQELTEEGDGTRIRCPFLSPESIDSALLEAPPDGIHARPLGGLSRTSGESLLHAGLLRDFCGLTLHAAAARVGRTACSTRWLVEGHHDLMARDPLYMEAVANILGAALREEYSEPVAARELTRQLAEVAPFAQVSIGRSGVSRSRGRRRSRGGA